MRVTPILALSAALLVFAGVPAQGLAPARAALAAHATAAPSQGSAGASSPTAGWPKFRGAWFDINYPPGFQAHAVPAGTPAAATDAARFLSPDGQVEFSVFSPLWNGDPPQLHVNPATERVIGDIRRVAGSDLGSGAIHQRWLTIAARNGSYQRAVFDDENVLLNARTTFGIKYQNQAAYARYRARYLAFKASLLQFGD